MPCNEASYHYYFLVSSQKVFKSEVLANFLHTFNMYLLCLWLIIPIATRCSTVLLITWFIRSWTSCINSLCFCFTFIFVTFSTYESISSFHSLSKKKFEKLCNNLFVSIPGIKCQTTGV